MIERKGPIANRSVIQVAETKLSLHLATFGTKICVVQVSVPISRCGLEPPFIEGFSMASQYLRIPSATCTLCNGAQFCVLMHCIACSFNRSLGRLVAYLIGDLVGMWPDTSQPPHGSRLYQMF